VRSELGALKGPRSKWRATIAILITGICELSFAGTATGEPTFARAESAVPSFCAHLPASSLSSALGVQVTYFEGHLLRSGSLVCTYGTFPSHGTFAAELDVSKHAGLRSSQLVTLAAREATIIHVPRHVTAAFAALPALGAEAFSCSYTVNGTRFLGVVNFAGTSGYLASLFGTPRLLAGNVRLHALERILALAMKA
jgi:hypothetical protein